MEDRRRKKFSCPVLIKYDSRSRVGFLAVGHHQRILYREFRQERRNRVWLVAGEKTDDFVRELQLALRQRKSNGRGRKTLARRIQRMFQFRRVRIPPSFRKDFPMPEKHKAVKFGFVMRSCFDEPADRRRGHPFLFRKASRERPLGGGRN